MQLTVIVSAPLDSPSGGFFYARRMVEGLRNAGHAISLTVIDNAHPAPDDAARGAARAALESGVRLLIDGLALSAFAGMGDALAAAGALGFVHNAVALGDGVQESERPALRNAALRLLPRLSRVIASSEAVAKRLAEEFGADPQRISVVVPGTDEAPRAAGSGGPGCAILSVGALIPRKGHDVLLRALARLFDLDWRLTIVGSADRDPAHAEMLRALAATLGIAEQVRVAGALSDADLDTLWNAADLFALASNWEAYGAAVADALRRGLPVAVSNGGAGAALVPVEAGVVVSPGDVEQLSKAMRRLIFSPTLRREMGNVAWEAGRTLPGWPQQVHAFAAALAD